MGGAVGRAEVIGTVDGVIFGAGPDELEDGEFLNSREDETGDERICQESLFKEIEVSKSPM